MLPLKSPYNILHFINILLSLNICTFCSVEIFLHSYPIFSALPKLTFFTWETQKFKFDKFLPHALSPTQNEPKEPKRSQINPYLDHETAIHILLEDTAYSFCIWIKYMILVVMLFCSKVAIFHRILQKTSQLIFVLKYFCVEAIYGWDILEIKVGQIPMLFNGESVQLPAWRHTRWANTLQPGSSSFLSSFVVTTQRNLCWQPLPPYNSGLFSVSLPWGMPKFHNIGQHKLSLHGGKFCNEPHPSTKRVSIVLPIARPLQAFWGGTLSVGNHYWEVTYLSDSNVSMEHSPPLITLYPCQISIWILSPCMKIVLTQEHTKVSLFLGQQVGHKKKLQSSMLILPLLHIHKNTQQECYA